MDVNKMTVEEIRKGYSENDMAVINGVLNNTIVPVTEEEKNQPEVSVEQEAAPVEEPEKDVSVETPEEQPVEKKQIDETEQARRYAQLIEEQEKAKQAELQEEINEKNKKLEQEQRIREELETKLQELRTTETVQQPLQTPQPEAQTDENAEYESDYAKRTREMLEELKQQIQQSSSNSEILAFQAKIDELQRKEEKREAERQAEKKRGKEAREQRKREELALLDVQDFQRKNPEYQLQRDYKDIDSDYRRFRKDIQYLSNAKTQKDLEDAIKEYYANGKMREIADEKGIREVPEYQKFEDILDLIDFKNGVKYNPETGQITAITNTEGRQVAYTSLDEAYKIKNFYSEVNKARLNSSNEIRTKLDQINNGPVLLSETETSKPDTSITPDIEREVMAMDPREAMKDPTKKKLYEAVYAKHGLEPPRIPGR